MVDKVTLNNLALFDPSIVATTNTNNATLTAAIDNTISRDGTAPNQMNADFDMNSHRILNLPAPLVSTEPLRLQDLTTGIIGPAGPSGAPLNNTRIAKTANYTVANADKGSTFSLGGNSLFTLTFNPNAGYDINFIVMVVNTDAATAKIITMSGFTSFFLWPGQTILVYNDNSVWRSTGPYRWVSGTMNFYVDPINGSDSNDGLAPGAGRAFQHINFGISFIQAQLDLKGGVGNLNLANGTYTESFTVFGGPTGGLEINIIGNPASPSSVVFNGTLACRDGGILSVNGVKFTSTGGQCLLVGQEFIVDLQNIEFGACTNGVHIQVNPGGYVNYAGGTYVVSGTALFHIQMTGQGSVFQVLTAQTISIPTALAFTTWVYNQSGYLTITGGTTFTGAGVASSIGKKFDTNYNGVTLLNGTTLPGNAAGTTTTGGQTV